MSSTLPISKSKPSSLDALMAYRTFASNDHNANKIVIGVSKQPACVVATAPDSWYGQFIQWLRRDDLVNDFRTALREQYGQTIEQVATKDITQLDGQMIRTALKKADAARAARDDIEAYTASTEINAQIASALPPVSEHYSSKQRLVDLNTLKAKMLSAQKEASKIFDSGTLAEADKNDLKPMLQKVTQALATVRNAATSETTRSGADAEYIKIASAARDIANQAEAEADVAYSAINQINDNLGKEITRINTKADQEIARTNADTTLSTMSDFAGGAIGDLMEKKAASIKAEAVQEITKACLAAKKNAAPYETTIARYNLAEEEAQAKEFIVNLRQINASADVIAAAVQNVSALEQRIVTAKAIITQAEQAETTASEIKDDPQLALDIFEATSAAKLIACKPDPEHILTSTKAELITITTKLVALITSLSLKGDDSADADLKLINESLPRFLLAEAQSPQDAIAEAAKIEQQLTQLSTAKRDRAKWENSTIHPETDSADAERIKVSATNYSDQADFLAQAAPYYRKLADAKKMELIKTNFEKSSPALLEKLEKLQSKPTSGPNNGTIQNTLTVLEALQGKISTHKHSFITDLLKLDSFRDKENIIGLNGKIMSQTDIPKQTSQAYDEAIALMRWSLFNKFGMRGVKNFDNYFTSVITQKNRNPITIGQFKQFLAEDSMTASNDCFILPTSSLSFLQDQLDKSSVTTIIKSGKTTSPFNPFLASSTQAGSPLQYLSALNEEQEQEEGKVAARKIITDFFKELDLDRSTQAGIRFDREFNAQSGPLTTEKLKQFLTEEMNKNYWVESLRRYLESYSFGVTALGALAYKGMSFMAATPHGFVGVATLAALTPIWQNAIRPRSSNNE